MTNRIELKFDKATTKLAGNPYGRSVFHDQLRDKIDYSKKNISKNMLSVKQFGKRIDFILSKRFI